MMSNGETKTKVLQLKARTLANIIAIAELKGGSHASIVERAVSEWLKKPNEWSDFERKQFEALRDATLRVFEIKRALREKRTGGNKG